MTDQRISIDQLSPHDLVERLMTLITDLTAVVTRETLCLRANRPLQIIDMQDEKQRLANDYALDIQVIRTRKDLLDRAPAERISRLKGVMFRLEEALKENADAITAAKSISERLIRAVAEACSQRQAPTLGYGPNATTQVPRASVAIALDARF